MKRDFKNLDNFKRGNPTEETEKQKGETKKSLNARRTEDQELLPLNHTIRTSFLSLEIGWCDKVSKSKASP